MFRYAGPVCLLLALVSPFLQCPSARSAESGCGDRKVGSFLASVPYFSRRMQGAGERSDTSVTLAHVDDERIRATFRLASVPPEEPTTRADYLRVVEASVKADADARRVRGEKVETGVFPYDPVSWSVAGTRGTEPDRETDGTLTIRVAPTCRLVVDWGAPAETVLVGRVQDFGAALSAVRTFAERRTVGGFVVDDYVPTGFRAILSGFIVPLAATTALVWLLRDMMFLERPSLAPRALAGVGALASAAAFYVQVPAFVSGLAFDRYVDQAMLLAMAVGLLLGAAALGSQKAVLSGLSASVMFGLSVGSTTALSWSTSARTSGALALVLVVCGISGLMAWRGASEAGARVAERRA